MGSRYDKKFTWVLKNFCSLRGDKISSNEFVAGCCNWRFVAVPKGQEGYNFLAVYLETAESNLPSGWRRHVNFRLSILNQFQEKLSRQREIQEWYGANNTSSGVPDFLLLSELHDVNRGFLVNGEITIVGEVKIIEVIGSRDVNEETSLVTESVELYGFQIPFSEVEIARLLFRKRPSIASQFRPQSQVLKTAYMTLLIGVVKILSQSPLEVSMECLGDVRRAGEALQDAGFNLEWLDIQCNLLRTPKEQELLAKERICAIEKKMERGMAATLKMDTDLESEKEALLASADSMRLEDLL